MGYEWRANARTAQNLGICVINPLIALHRTVPPILYHPLGIDSWQQNKTKALQEILSCASVATEHAWLVYPGAENLRAVPLENTM